MSSFDAPRPTNAPEPFKAKVEPALKRTSPALRPKSPQYTTWLKQEVGDDILPPMPMQEPKDEREAQAHERRVFAGKVVESAQLTLQDMIERPQDFGGFLNYPDRSMRMPGAVIGQGRLIQIEEGCVAQVTALKRIVRDTIRDRLSLSLEEADALPDRIQFVGKGKSHVSHEAAQAYKKHRQDLERKLEEMSLF